MTKPITASKPIAKRPAMPQVPPAYRPDRAAPVQAKSALPAVRPPPPAPPVFMPSPRAVIQRAEMPKSIAYTSIANHYTPDQIKLAAQQTGHDVGYTGHVSGGPGDGMNNATVRANADIVEQLHKNVAKEKANKKKAPVKNERPKSARWKALNKATLLMTGALAVKPNADAAIEQAGVAYDTYLTVRSEHGGSPDDFLTEDDVDDCNAYWLAMVEARKVLDAPL